MPRLGTRRRPRDRSGQALAEFALVAPIFFLMLFGVIQLGLLMASQNGLVNGVRDATRKAATYRVSELSFDSMTSLCSTVRTQLSDDLRGAIPGFMAANLTPVSISYEWNDDPSGATGFWVAHIDATYANPLYVPLVGVVLHPSDPGTFPLSASEQMRVENPALTGSGSHTCP
jgi:Flp pilus assembly protein TadG